MTMIEDDEYTEPMNGNGITTANGKQMNPMLAMGELGVNSPYKALPIDPNPQFSPLRYALRTYEKMKLNDSTVRNSLKVCKFQVLGGDWYVEPASDSQEDQDIAEFVHYNLFDCMSTTWMETLQHMLTSLDYGFSVLEAVWCICPWRPYRPNSNSRDMVMLRKLAPRPAITIGRFVYDYNGGPVGVEHYPVDPNEGYGSYPGTWSTEDNMVRIPIEKLVVMTNDKEGGDLLGLSVLRSAYLHWYFKHKLYDIDAIQKERHGMGVPDIQLPPSYTQEDLKFAAQLAQSLRTNARGFVLRPQGWEFGFAKVEGQLTNALESADHHDMMINRNVLAQFINSTTGNSRSNTATAYDLFEKVQRQTGRYVCDTINKYLIKQLVDYNYKVARYPKMKVRGIGQARDLQQFSAGMRNLVSENIISIDDDTEKYVRDVIDLPTSWDKDNVRVNEMLLKPFTDPSGIPVATGGNAGTASAQQVKGQRGKVQGAGTANDKAKSNGKGRGPTSGNMNKGPSDS